MNRLGRPDTGIDDIAARWHGRTRSGEATPAGDAAASMIRCTRAVRDE